MASAFGPQIDTAAPATPSKDAMGGRKPLSILVVGGSHAGLFIAILLKRQGHNVRVLERVTSSARSGLAAGIGRAAWVKRFFDENDRLKDLPFGVVNDFLAVLDKDLNIKQQIPMHFHMTTWDATYYRLRANFDGLESSYCPRAPAMDPREGEGIYETGRTVLHVDDVGDDLLKVLTEDATTGQQRSYEADAIIAADGANSTIRKQFQPNIRREEPGYVLWRGTIPTNELSKDILDNFDGRTTLYPMPYSYTIVTVASEQDNDILTDRDGHVHHTTLPKGGMRPEIWSRQLQHAKETLPPLLYEIVTRITEPFASVVSTIHTPQASFCNNRLFLLGDAQTQCQPNTGQGTNLAAMDAILLAQVFAGDLSPQDWEAEVMRTRRRQQASAVAFASLRLNGWWGRSVAYLRLWWVVLWQDVWAWWAGDRARL